MSMMSRRESHRQHCRQGARRGHDDIVMRTAIDCVTAAGRDRQGGARAPPLAGEIFLF